MASLRKIKGKYGEILSNKKVPILTIDGRWHELFPDKEKTPEIKILETKVNDLLKKQGQANTELKDYSLLKKKVMGDVMTNMEATLMEANDDLVKKLEQSKKMILDINNKLEAHERNLEKYPDEIKKVNHELLLESVSICYDKMSKNQEEIDKLAEWIEGVRIELKNKLIEKQEKEEINNKIYSYMHDLLGHTVMEIFDLQKGGIE